MIDETRFDASGFIGRINAPAIRTEIIQNGLDKTYTWIVHFDDTSYSKSGYTHEGVAETEALVFGTKLLLSRYEPRG
jgi:hypothetical protein